MSRKECYDVSLLNGRGVANLGMIFRTRTIKTMKLNQTLALIASFTTALQLATAGNITGKVTLKGAPPAEKEIAGVTDPVCSAAHPTPMKTRFYMVGTGGELADTVVMLKGITGKSTGASAAPLLIDQNGCEYLPYVGAVQTGQKISVKNSDQTMHNVHPTPVNTAGGNKEENKAQFAGAADLTFSFPAAETFLRFKCDVHPWMFSYITVVDHVQTKDPQHQDLETDKVERTT